MAPTYISIHASSIPAQEAPMTPSSGGSRMASSCTDPDVLLLHARLLKNDKKGSPQSGMGMPKGSPFKQHNLNPGPYSQEVMAVV